MLWIKSIWHFVSKSDEFILGYEFPNGRNFFEAADLIDYMKQDGNWLPVDLVLPIVSL